MKSKNRIYAGWFFLILAFVIWIPSGDVVDMIIRQKEILLGRYTRGHFGALVFLSIIFLGISGLCFSKIKTVGEMVLVGVMVFVSTIVSGFVLVVGSGMVNKPRYVESEVATIKNGVELKGFVRNRPPNEFYELEQHDVPEQKRSYPNAPAGYPSFNLTLTSDKYGFRNKTVLDQYPIVAVGDSFVAGSHVSDEQTWAHLLSGKLNKDIYNLGVSGSDPGIYFNNFVMLGQQFKPKLVLFMLYEGNDFKDVSPIVVDSNDNASAGKKAKKKKSLLGKISYWASASPVTKGLDRLSSEVLEPIGKDRPVTGYQEKVGWMPVKVPTPKGDQYYGFEPKRLTYLYETMDGFGMSESWLAVKHIMKNMVAMGEREGFQVVFIYAPSTPHVVMPLVRDQIPANQLRNFAAYQLDNLPPDEKFKQEMFDYMNNEEDIFLEQCEMSQWHCLSLTSALRQATAEGVQAYYSYDQHWTPDGNRVVAETINNYLMPIRLSQLGRLDF